MGKSTFITAGLAAVRGAILAYLFMAVTGCKMSNGEESGNPIRDIRACLDGYAMLHGGALPPSLQALAEDIKRQGSTYAFFERWKPFYYVANLTTNDPPRMPVLMSDPKMEGKHGRALLLDGEVLYYRHLDEATVQQMVTEPWELVRHSFGDVQAFEAFKKRIVLQAPPRSRRGRPTSQP